MRRQFRLRLNRIYGLHVGFLGVFLRSIKVLWSLRKPIGEERRAEGLGKSHRMRAQSCEEERMDIFPWLPVIFFLALAAWFLVLKRLDAYSRIRRWLEGEKK